MLLVEYVGISFALDAQIVRQRGGVWDLVGRVGALGPLGVVCATAWVVTAGGGGTAWHAQLSIKPNLLLLGVHLALFGVFLWITQRIFGGLVAPTGPAEAWLLAWVLAGLSAMGSLALAFVSDWEWLKRVTSRAVVLGGTLGLAAWLAGWAAILLWPVMTFATFGAVETILRLLTYAPTSDAASALLRLEGFTVTVAPGCSGLEGMGLCAVLVSGLLYHNRLTLRFPHVLILIPLGVAVMWLGNALRIAMLMIVGARIDAGIAVGSFHSKAGWVFFCAVTLAIAALARHSSWFQRPTARVATFDNPTAMYLMPIIAWIGVGLVTSTLANGHDPLYALRVVVTLAVLWVYRDSYRLLWQVPSRWAWIVGGVVGVFWLFTPLAPGRAMATELPEAWSGLQRTTWIVFRCVGSVLCVPLAEELAFRGYLSRWLTNRGDWGLPYSGVSWFGILGSALAFGALHDSWQLAVATGIVYSLLLRRTGRLLDAVMAHACSNGVIALWVLGTGDWRHW